VVLLEGSADPRVFVIQGELGVAWWSRMDGRAGRDEEYFVQEAAAAAGVEVASCREAFRLFLDRLRDLDLVVLHTDPRPSADPADLDFPTCVTDLDVAARCHPFDVEAYTAQDMVALGTFFAGQDNVSGTSACVSTRGGQYNTTGTAVCHG
jgi:hypothetical protein